MEIVGRTISFDKPSNLKQENGSGIGKTVYTKAQTVVSIGNVLEAATKTTFMTAKCEGFTQIIDSVTNRYLNLSNPSVHRAVMSLRDDNSIYDYLKKNYAVEVYSNDSSDKKNDDGTFSVNDIMLQEVDNVDKSNVETIKAALNKSDKEFNQAVEGLRSNFKSSRYWNFFYFRELLKNEKFRRYLINKINQIPGDVETNCLVPFSPVNTIDEFFHQYFKNNDIVVTSLTFEDWLALVDRCDYIGTTMDGELASSGKFRNAPVYRVDQMNWNSINYSWWAYGFHEYDGQVLPNYIFRTRAVNIATEFPGLAHAESQGVALPFSLKDRWFCIDLAFKHAFCEAQGENIISRCVTEGNGSVTRCGAVITKSVNLDEKNDVIESLKQKIIESPEWDDMVLNGFIPNFTDVSSYDINKSEQEIIASLFYDCDKASLDIFSDHVNYNFIALKRNDPLMLNTCQWRSESELPTQYRNKYKLFASRSELYHRVFTLLYLNGCKITNQALRLFKQNEQNDNSLTILVRGRPYTMAFDCIKNFASWAGTIILETIGDAMYYATGVDTILSKGISSGLIRVLSELTYSSTWTEFINRDTTASGSSQMPAWIFGLTSGVPFNLVVNGKLQCHSYYTHRLSDRIIAYLCVDSTEFTSHYSIERLRKAEEAYRKKYHEALYESNFLKIKEKLPCAVGALNINNEADIKAYLDRYVEFPEEKNFQFIHPDTLARLNNERDKRSPEIKFDRLKGIFNIQEDIDNFYRSMLYEGENKSVIVAAMTMVSLRRPPLIQFQLIEKRDLRNPNSWQRSFLGSIQASTLLEIVPLEKANTPFGMDLTHLTPLFIQKWKLGSLQKSIEFLVLDEEERSKLTKDEKLIKLHIGEDLKCSFKKFLGDGDE